MRHRRPLMHRPSRLRGPNAGRTRLRAAKNRDIKRITMNADDELCLCFHVTRRKVEQFIRVRRPAVASQLSECYGAGTGCGWCRPFLQRLHANQLGDDAPDAAAYAAARAAYREQQKQRLGKPSSGAGEE